MLGLDKRHCSRGVIALNAAQVQDYLSQLPNWQVTKDEKSIWCRYQFKNYEQALVFVNAAADIAHTEDHHPDISFGYNYCEIYYSTHSVKGLSENDFICAARIDNVPQS